MKTRSLVMRLAPGKRVTAMVALLTGVLAISPHEWVSNLGAWASLIARSLPAVPSVVLLMMLVKQIWVREIEYMAPHEHRGVPELAPSGIESRITGILDDLSVHGRGNVQVVRIVVATGSSVLRYLHHLVNVYEARAHWDIRILIMHPDSEQVLVAGRMWRHEIIESCRMLTEIKERARQRSTSAKIAWRGYMNVPVIRGVLFNEQHLFYGFFTWIDEAGRPQLHEQNGSFIHVRAGRGDPVASDTIEAFKNWFDHEWGQKREIELSEGTQSEPSVNG